MEIFSCAVELLELNYFDALRVSRGPPEAQSSCLFMLSCRVSEQNIPTTPGHFVSGQRNVQTIVTHSTQLRDVNLTHSTVHSCPTHTHTRRNFHSTNQPSQAVVRKVFRQRSTLIYHANDKLNLFLSALLPRNR